MYRSGIFVKWCTWKILSHTVASLHPIDSRLPKTSSWFRLVVFFAIFQLISRMLGNYWKCFKTIIWDKKCDQPIKAPSKYARKPRKAWKVRSVGLFFLVPGWTVGTPAASGPQRPQSSLWWPTWMGVQQKSWGAHWNLRNLRCFGGNKSNVSLGFLNKNILCIDSGS